MIITAFPGGVPQQQPLTALPERLAWTAVLLALVVWLIVATWRSWRRRQAVAEGAFALPPVPDPLSAVVAEAEGTYLGTTSVGTGVVDFRLFPGHDLAFPAAGRMAVLADGVLFARTGGADVFVPATELRRVSLADGFAGRYVERNGVVVVEWALPARSADGAPAELNTGYRVRSAADVGPVVRALQSIAPGAAEPLRSPPFVT